MRIITIGLDLTKHWFRVHGIEAAGKVVTVAGGVASARRACPRGYARTDTPSARYRQGQQGDDGARILKPRERPSRRHE